MSTESFHAHKPTHVDLFHDSGLEAVALELAPAFRDKLDFSKPEDYDKLAEYAFTAAKAFVAKRDALLAEAQDKDDDEFMKAKRNAELATTKEASHV